MWIQSGEYRGDNSLPASKERVAAMMLQCKESGLGGCNCNSICQAKFEYARLRRTETAEQQFETIMKCVRGEE